MKQLPILLSSIALIGVLVVGSIGGGLSQSDVNAIVADAVSKLGAVSSNVLPNPFIQVNGVRTWQRGTSNLNAASYTFCSLQSPNATTTLVDAGFTLTTSTTSASTVYIAKTTVSALASTTLLASLYAVGAGAQVSLTASSTQGAAGQVNILGPNTYINMGFGPGETGGIANLAPVGHCSAVFREL